MTTYRRSAATTCGGTYYEGPGRRYAYCCRCLRVSYDHYEGDRCHEPPRKVRSDYRRPADGCKAFGHLFLPNRLNGPICCAYCGAPPTTEKPS